MNLPWHKLGPPAGRGGTLPDLKAYYGSDWNPLSKYFLPTRRLATSICCPNPGGYGCPRKIVEHSFHNIVAVCGNSPKECEPVTLTRQDLVIHELKIEKLLSDLSNILQIKGKAPVQFMPLTWELGTYSGQGRVHSSVYLSLSADPEKLQEAAISLIAQKETPLFLLVPSWDLCSVSLVNTAEKAGVLLISLDNLHDWQNTADGVDLLGKYVRPEQPRVEEENVFRLEKENWRVIFRGRAYTIRQSVGMQYITHLIQRAHNDEPEIHVSDLFYHVQKKPAVKETYLSNMSSEQVSELGLDVSGLGEGLDLMTPEGKQWAWSKIKELEALIEEVEETGNTREALKLRENKEALEEHIDKAHGLSGRARKSSDPNEKVRKSVSKAVGYVLNKLGRKDDPPDEFALYLNDHLNTSFFCSFRKDPKISWKIIKK